MDDGAAERNAQMLAAHAAGVPVVEIAQRFDLSLSWTGSLLRHHLGADVPETGRGIRCDLDEAQLAGEYRRGATVRALADAYGVSYGTVHRRLSKAGVTFRPRGTPRD
ncbi:helix-turn-helix domain-containing protein [Amycolatopsis nivea]|uniref:helix-turn-helix domain-containing protein n=1 Tax=Amycolatopsis nivea TaxID=1644109 RepID=UPI0010700920|nr:helix-turn-helix domain-containing protein [Amycolatopsis nivea]